MLKLITINIFEQETKHWILLIKTDNNVLSECLTLFLPPKRNIQMFILPNEKYDNFPFYVKSAAKVLIS